MACEKCWGDAYLRYRLNPEKTQADHYQDLLKEREGNPCTPEEQLGQWAAGRVSGEQGKKSENNS